VVGKDTTMKKKHKKTTLYHAEKIMETFPGITEKDVTRLILGKVSIKAMRKKYPSNYFKVN